MHWCIEFEWNGINERRMNEWINGRNSERGGLSSCQLPVPPLVRRHYFGLWAWLGWRACEARSWQSPLAGAGFWPTAAAVLKEEEGLNNLYVYYGEGENAICELLLAAKIGNRKRAESTKFEFEGFRFVALSPDKWGGQRPAVQESHQDFRTQKRRKEFVSTNVSEGAKK